MSEGEQQELQKHLQKELPRGIKRSFTRLNEDTDESESEEEDNEGPITRRTRNLIYQMWGNIAVENPDKYLQLVDKISKLTEAQAIAYYESMEASRNAKVHTHLSKRILNYLANKIMHPNDEDGRKELQEDIHVQSEMSSWLSYGLSYTHPFSVPLVLVIYSLASHIYYGKKNVLNIGGTTQTISTAPSTIQNDGMRQESNGENNTNG
jgi:hypothetical protein